MGITRWCASHVAYVGPKSRTERPRETKVGTESRDSDTTFKFKRSKVNLQGRGHIVAASRTACYVCINLNLNTFNILLSSRTINQRPTSNDPVDAPTLDEIRAAVKKLKLDRAAGGDAIPPVMLIMLAVDPTCRQ